MSISKPSWRFVRRFITSVLSSMIIILHPLKGMNEKNLHCKYEKPYHNFHSVHFQHVFDDTARLAWNGPVSGFQIGTLKSPSSSSMVPDVLSTIETITFVQLPSSDNWIVFIGNVARIPRSRTNPPSWRAQPSFHHNRFCPFSITSSAIPSLILSLIHIWRCRRYSLCRSRWSPYH